MLSRACPAEMRSRNMKRRGYLGEKYPQCAYGLDLLSLSGWDTLVVPICELLVGMSNPQDGGFLE